MNENDHDDDDDVSERDKHKTNVNKAYLISTEKHKQRVYSIDI